MRLDQVKNVIPIIPAAATRIARRIAVARVIVDENLQYASRRRNKDLLKLRS
jgi:hypothetical protein